MEATALSVTLMLPVLLLGADSQHSYGEDVDAGLAWIIPTRLQLFDYSSVSFHCEGPNTTAGWRVLRRIMGEVSPCVSNWETTRPTVCAVKPVYTTDSGEYWCETGDGQRSNTVNITVTAGDVILDSPVLPVVEGDAATLRCRSKKTSSAHVADFYKDGLLTGTGSFGEMTIARVSKAHEGFYKCSISDYGVSPESWLAVRAARRDAPASSSSSSSSCHVYLISRTVFTILMVALLSLLVGLLHCGKLPKHRVGSPRQ